MSEKNTIVVKRHSDGSVFELLPDGSSRRLDDRTDWPRVKEMTDDEVMALALSDPDAQPAEQPGYSRRQIPRVRALRRALSLTQEEFAMRYHIPIGMLRDWEQGRIEPDEPARAYLTLIAHDPEFVERALRVKSPAL
jgi:putative transcriptional regulator